MIVWRPTFPDVEPYTLKNVINHLIFVSAETVCGEAGRSLGLSGYK